MADMGARIAVERGERDLGQVAREHIGEDRLALDDAGVAEARLARRLVQAIDDRDRPPARLKRERGRDADDPRAKHNHVDGSRRHDKLHSVRRGCASILEARSYRPARERLPTTSSFP